MFMALLVIGQFMGVPLTFVKASTSSEIEKLPQIIKDPSLKVELVFKGLPFSTGMAILGHDDVLVLEKKNGTVQRIVNGEMLSEPLVDLNVANKGERGLLGIAISKNTDVDKTNVFLFFTESKYNLDDREICKVRNHCTSGNPVGHRLYRYELVNNELINPQLVLDLPSNPGAAHLGGVITIGPDNNLYVITGDGDSCEFQSCRDNISGSVVSAQTANVQNGDLPAGRGGIIRVTQDGKAADDGNGNGILGDKYPLNMYYAYGIRNSFGLDFDPLTGNLWDTENGPAFGDEINLVEPGFNSGWIRVQGFWPINNSSLLDDNQTFSGYAGKNEVSEEPDNLVDFDKHGRYSNPEFSWNLTVGVTSLEFFNSDKLGKQYKNDLFVGDINWGNIYHFDLKENRTELDLPGPLKDKIAGDFQELQEVVFAKGFGGGITDIETGPDGYMYILTGNGAIYRIS
jgi:glucose/arabinose dehydrogenase